MEPNTIMAALANPVIKRATTQKEIQANIPIIAGDAKLTCVWKADNRPKGKFYDRIRFFCGHALH